MIATYAPCRVVTPPSQETTSLRFLRRLQRIGAKEVRLITLQLSPPSGQGEARAAT